MGAYGELAATMQRAPDFYSSYLNSLLGTWQAGHLAEDRRLALAKEALAQKLQEAQIANSASEVAWRQQQADMDKRQRADAEAKDKAASDRQAREDAAKAQTDAEKTVGGYMHPVPITDVLSGAAGSSDTTVTPRDEAGNPTGPSFSPGDFGQMATVSPDAVKAIAARYGQPPEVIWGFVQGQRGPYEQALQLAAQKNELARQAEISKELDRKTALAIAAGHAAKEGPKYLHYSESKDGYLIGIDKAGIAHLVRTDEGQPIQVPPTAAETNAETEKQTMGWLFHDAPPPSTATPGAPPPPTPGAAPADNAATSPYPGSWEDPSTYPPPMPAPPNIRRPAGKALDAATAAQFLRQAGGDKKKARALARAAGYSF